MNSLFAPLPALAMIRLFQSADGGGAGGDAPPADAPPADTGAQPPADAQPPAAKWWEGEAIPEQHRNYLTAKGLTVDDPNEALRRLVDIAAHAEKKIGRGVDQIIDKPAKGQSYAEWARANAAALGLPEAEDAYTAKQPDFWPKDMPWDAEMEMAARKIAFAHGVTPEAHQAYVEAFAGKMKALNDASAAALEKATGEMMNDLQRDFGAQTPAVIARAKQAAQFYAEQAGLSSEALQALSHSLADKIGDAGTIRLFNFMAEQMGEDSLKGRGMGSLSMTPADARAELQKLQGPGGAWFEASAKGDHITLKALEAQVSHLRKLAYS